MIRVIPTTYGVILMILALYKATEYWKLSAGFEGFTLVKVLVLDFGIWPRGAWQLTIPDFYL